MSDIDINHVLSELRAMSSAAQGQPLGVAKPDSGVDFAALLKSSIDKVNESQAQASNLAEAFETGETQADLTEVMVALQKARISFQAMVEVRNKLVTAYQDVMNMQI